MRRWRRLSGPLRKCCTTWFHLHAAQHDALLWEDQDFLAEKVAEWKASTPAASEPPSPPPFRAVASAPRVGGGPAGDEPDLLDLARGTLSARRRCFRRLAIGGRTGTRKANAASPPAALQAGHELAATTLLVLRWWDVLGAACG